MGLNPSTLLLLPFVVVIVWWLIRSITMVSKEKFTIGIQSRLHAKVDSDGNPIYWDYLPPSMTGEHGCTQVACPENRYEDNITCWHCCNYH